MSYLGVRIPSNKVVFGGNPLKVIQKVETATNMYPGRLVVKGTNDDDVVVSDGLKAPEGWLDFDATDPNYIPADITTLYAANDQAKVVSGNCFVYMPSGLATGTTATKNDVLLSWTNGQVVPGVVMGGKTAIKVPFVQKTSAFDTGIDIPGGVIISDVIIDVVTNVAGSSIDVGFINATESGDEDGLIDGESCVNSGLQTHVLVDATAGNITTGAYLKTVIAEANGSSATNLAVPIKYKTDGTIKSLCYKTSAHAVTGWIYVFVESPGVKVVGKALLGASAASQAADVVLESLI
jgi:hypothetical protein